MDRLFRRLLWSCVAGAGGWVAVAHAAEPPVRSRATLPRSLSAEARQSGRPASSAGSEARIQKLEAEIDELLGRLRAASTDSTPVEFDAPPAPAEEFRETPETPPRSATVPQRANDFAPPRVRRADVGSDTPELSEPTNPDDAEFTPTDDVEFARPEIAQSESVPSEIVQVQQIQWKPTRGAAGSDRGAATDKRRPVPQPTPDTRRALSATPPFQAPAENGLKSLAPQPVPKKSQPTSNADHAPTTESDADRLRRLEAEIAALKAERSAARVSESPVASGTSVTPDEDPTAPAANSPKGDARYPVGAASALPVPGSAKSASAANMTTGRSARPSASDALPVPEMPRPPSSGGQVGGSKNRADTAASSTNGAGSDVAPSRVQRLEREIEALRKANAASTGSAANAGKPASTGDAASAGNGGSGDASDVPEIAPPPPANRPTSITADRSHGPGESARSAKPGAPTTPHTGGSTSGSPKKNPESTRANPSPARPTGSIGPNGLPVKKITAGRNEFPPPPPDPRAIAGEDLDAAGAPTESKRRTAVSAADEANDENRIVPTQRTLEEGEAPALPRLPLSSAPAAALPEDAAGTDAAGEDSAPASEPSSAAPNAPSAQSSRARRELLIEQIRTARQTGGKSKDAAESTQAEAAPTPPAKQPPRNTPMADDPPDAFETPDEPAKLPKPAAGNKAQSTGPRQPGEPRQSTEQRKPAAAASPAATSNQAPPSSACAVPGAACAAPNGAGHTAPSRSSGAVCRPPASRCAPCQRPRTLASVLNADDVFVDGGLTVYAGFDLMFVQPRFENTDALIVTTGGDTSTKSFEFEYQLSPRAVFGMVGEDGLGMRFQLWQFDHGTRVNDQSAGVMTPDIEGVGFLLAAAGNELKAEHSLQFQVYDLEGTWHQAFQTSALTVAGGVRYLHMEQRYDVQRVTAAGAVNGTLRHDHDFEGLGPTIGAEWVRPLGDFGLAVYASGRGSILFGTRDQVATLNDAGAVTRDAHFNQASQMALGEAGVGLQFLSDGLTVRLGYEGQVWTDAGTATTRTGNMGLNGFFASFGLSY